MGIIKYIVCWSLPLIGLIIGFCTITLIASENEEYIEENSVGLYCAFPPLTSDLKIPQVYKR